MEQVAETAPSASGAGTEGPAGKKRPRIDLSIDHRERKRGKSMFGILLGTLNKAKKEDLDRNTSEAVGAIQALHQRSYIFNFRRLKRGLRLIAVCRLKEQRKRTMLGDLKK